MNNLFYNALNYCLHKVEVELLEVQQYENIFSIEFRNDGYLIPLEMKDKIFEPFFRLRANQNKSGSGIGLALSKSLADLHKGSICLKGSENAMNVFVVTLPLHQKINNAD